MAEIIEKDPLEDYYMKSYPNGDVPFNATQLRQIEEIIRRVLLETKGHSNG